MIDLTFVPIHLGLPVVDFAFAMDFTCVIENALGDSGFSSIYMSRRNVTNLEKVN